MYLKWGGIVTKCGKQPIDFREHDKGPELFFEVVIRLHREGCQFYLSVLGEQFTDYLGNSQTHKQSSYPFHSNNGTMFIDGVRWNKSSRHLPQTTREHILYYIFMNTIPSYEEWFASFWNRTMSCWLWSRSTLCFYAEVFENSRATLQDHILHWGYLPSKAQFLKVLESADIAVSTALHEFFGVSM